MVTCIDVGNSAIKVARVVNGEVGPVTRIPTIGDPVAALLAALGSPVDDLALVSVVPDRTAQIRDLAVASGRRLFQADVGTIPLATNVNAPRWVGADRLLGAWTSRELFGVPVIAVDVGTATTLDVVDAEGTFVGGAILPGPSLAIRSLVSDTALLPDVAQRLPNHAIGRGTVEAIQSGVLLGHRAAIEGLLVVMARELGGALRPRVVLTGGGAPLLGPIAGVDDVEPDLLMRGLGMLAGRRVVSR